MSILPRPGTGRPSNAGSALPVFADPTGRRRRRMRRAGACAAATLTGCLTVVAVGLLGGPQAPFVPWAAPHSQANAGPGRTRATTKSADAPAAAPSHAAVLPLPSPRPDQSSSPSLNPSPGASPRPAVTNRAGKTPPGHNRSKRPRPSPSGRAHAG